MPYFPIFLVLYHTKRPSSQDIYNAEQSTELSSKAQKLLKKNKKRTQNTGGDVKNNLEKTLAPHATCEKLAELYTKNFEQNKEDVAWMKRAAKLLNKKKSVQKQTSFFLFQKHYTI